MNVGLEEYASGVLENMALGKIFAAKREEVIGGCKKLRKKELHYLCSLPNIIRGVHVCLKGEINV